MYERYVDDVDLSVEATEPGTRYEHGRLRVDQQQAVEEKDQPADLRTFRVIQAIGNTIHPSIQLEIDVPSNHTDDKLPILDLKMWIKEVEISGNRERKLVHEHYIKDVASKFVIERESAMAISSKRTILTQMCLRAMLNCSHFLGEGTRKHRTEGFMQRMQASGYDEAFRLEVLKSAINAYRKICDDGGGKPAYRSKASNTPIRRKEVKKKRRNWFRRGGYGSVLFVPATYRSAMKNLFQEEISRSNLKIKVVERSGRKIKQILQKNDPFKDGKCGSPKCMVCNTTGKGRCRRNGIIYNIRCKDDCDDFEYRGETFKNAYSRGNEHINQFRTGASGSVMKKHSERVHGGRDVEFEMEVMDYVRNDATLRQVTEAVRILEVPEERRMNDNTEWNVARIPRIVITT